MTFFFTNRSYINDNKFSLNCATHCSIFFSLSPTVRNLYNRNLNEATKIKSNFLRLSNLKIVQSIIVGNKQMHFLRVLNMQFHISNAHGKSNTKIDK
ncbi:hypothetical protein Glove_209g20 [Diversispora epigaea]|uniref:Uncharacterized protein n=1 Tax=Diversispora epigaea TaxID=1348612 RepID=A0A397IS32_9GLOM|nr:hypothetical protein Glove_209g20 [Diversispora epigaea]